MHKDIETLADALDGLASTVLSSWSSDATACEGLGWYAPAISRQDLAGMASTFAVDLRASASETVSEVAASLLSDAPRRLQVLQANTVPQMFGSNGGQAIPAYVNTLTFLRTMLLPGIGWQVLPDARALPSAIARRARAAQAELEQISPNLSELSRQIQEIQAAHKIADTLPIDLQALAEARQKLAAAVDASQDLSKKIDTAWFESHQHLDWMKKHNEEAGKLIKQCETAYQVTTTKGLAGAFDQRANRLAQSTWTWVAGLVFALGLGSLIGAARLELLSSALQSTDPNWGGILTQALLSILSVGAPLWFAWLATKQIGQRFRLSEDYAFKASVAKAYEGYRKEAARIDPAFEARLFGSALDRLEEAPLRLVESSTHGSPWHELLNSPVVARTFKNVPELQQRLEALLRDAMNVARRDAKPQEAVSDSKPPTAAAKE